jgi:DivIVA domain-containing protein
MEETPRRVDALDGATFREASFPLALRGYDRQAVHAFLDRIADWLDEQGAPAAEARLTSEFAKVGERTSGILTAAEEAAAKLRSDAKEYAERLRGEAADEARKVRLNASQKSDELISDAQEKADRIIEDAVARRSTLNRAVASLMERRDEIADEAQRLADELLAAVEAIRSDRPADDVVEPPQAEEPEEPTPGEETAQADEEGTAFYEQAPPAPPEEGEPTQLEPPDERETAVHDVR